MKGFLYLISFSVIAVGSCFILHTIKCRNTMTNILSIGYEKIISAFAIVIGILLILSSFKSQNLWFFILLGVIAIFKGFFIMFNPKNSFDSLRDWYLNTASDQIYRLFGIIAIIIGTVMISWI